MDRSFLDEPRWLARTGRRLMRATPSKPRCKVCYSPFRGPGGILLRFTGFAPSRKNPNFCNTCFEKAPQGGIELEVGVMFADMRGFTALSETMPADRVAALVNRFYAAATDVLIKHDGIIDKMAGDEVMALFIPHFVGPNYVREMVRAAVELLEAVQPPGEAAWCPLGIGLDAGAAFVGNVGAGDVKDFTAIGDVVNTAARLQSQASAGQIVMAASVYEQVGELFPAAAAVDLELRGKAEPVRAHVVDLAATRGTKGVPAA